MPSYFAGLLLFAFIGFAGKIMDKAIIVIALIYFHINKKD